MCPRVKGLKSLMFFFCWLFHVSKIETSYSEDSDPKAHVRGWLVRRRKLHLTLGLNHKYTDTQHRREDRCVSTATQQMLLRMSPARYIVVSGYIII